MSVQDPESRLRSPAAHPHPAGDVPWVSLLWGTRLGFGTPCSQPVPVVSERVSIPGRRQVPL